ncbi:acetyl-CoA carboxylase biotin carboxylase subunit [Propylenella binzhouense]|uniref:propionyl-CoA carboxylase n=1 Tax=Propylenella binzhouense TaxID=2555902 RepID=A0A964T7Z2_9HYPH|nr:acetyl/propionyl/methylcrotonyl-CoA carboxylase subunit alpha [Propylenella binzhouense]MYZ50221.1 acetyl/propionyl/methylcrotonyl-CoA carboxylase subunit alpha [Propylenella binzhouense]
MFDTILIANRGEIACRIIRTARRMGIRTVAVCSEADRNALHVEMADEAVEIGPPPAARSYLSIDRILDACRATGADAVHPGYGFLSENAAFARALEAAGIVFIGPPPAAIEAMGDKIESKRFAERAGVSIVPGYPGEIADADEALRIAEEVGFPVMIKASAGGGGKGMRIARSAREVSEGFQLARSEARSSFGDDRVFIEKFIEEPRHIEIQVLADGHGNAVHLLERECSIQRRNQKVVEEAPSAFLDAGTRAAMGEQALALARAVGYRSAGTVEFIVDRDRNFYFLEMNTRLQVEHPVTELVTGIDLVEQMIRIAAGETLALAQADIVPRGWAIEARIYAEDPYRNFLPSIGRLTHYRPPEEGSQGGVTVRNDTGVYEGAEISLFYDPMIAKLCTHAPTRGEATDAMAEALDAFTVDGIRHNIPFLSALMTHPRWREGRLSTAFIAEEYPDGFQGVGEDSAGDRTFALIAASIEIEERRRRSRADGRLAPAGPPGEAWCAMIDRKVVPLTIHAGGPGELSISVDGAALVAVASGWRPGERVWRGLIGGEPVTAQVARRGTLLEIARRGRSVSARLVSPTAGRLQALMPEKAAADTSRVLLCPMPGLVVSIAVAEGQKVEPGEALATVEAMKMENVLRAEREVVVKAIRARPGESLAVDAVIMEFE